MKNYSLYKSKNPRVLINEGGFLNYENRNNLVIELEVDYNSFSEDELIKIKCGLDKEFEEVTTFESLFESERTNSAFIGVLENEKKAYKSIKSENSTLNFRFIKHEICIYKKDISEDNLIHTFDKSHAKQTGVLKLSDGDYKVVFNIFNFQDEFISTSVLDVILKTNYYSMNSNKTDSNEIIFDENEGDFVVEISPQSNKYYTFIISDIYSKSDKIFYFDFYNKHNDSVLTRGRIGAELKILNDKQIDEYEKTPELANEIKGEFIFNITEVFTEEQTKKTIGRMRIPTVKEKISDNFNSYFDLKCDINSTFESTVNLYDKLLITDQFKSEPLFYKFLIDEDIVDFKLYCCDGIPVENYKIVNFAEGINFVYFSIKRNKKYYYENNNAPPTLVSFKKSYEEFKFEMVAESVINFDENMYFDNLIIKSDTRDDSVDVTIVFDDFTKKDIVGVPILKTSEEVLFLPNERIKLNKKIKTIKINNPQNLTILNLISNSKVVKDSIVYYKKDQKDFVYIAEEIKEINLELVDQSSLYNLKIYEKFTIKNNEVVKVVDGPLMLNPILNSEIIFTDLDEYYEEKNLSKISPVIVEKDDEFYNKNFKKAGAIIWEK